jgi:CRISPR/Cas system-associated protein Csm6
MNTIVEIPDSLLDEVRELASAEGTTVKAVVEEGLRKILTERKQRGSFRLRKATFRENGLQPHVKAASWQRVRDLAYEGRGG